MNFNNLVLDMFKSVFDQYDLKIVDQFDGYIKLKSPYVVMIISQDERENSHSFSAGRDAKRIIQIQNDTIKEVFRSDLKLRLSPAEAFLTDLLAFLNDKGQLILKGNVKKFIEMEQFFDHKNEEYHNKMMHQQLMESADSAWEKKDYREFMRCLNRTNFNNLSDTYKLKYKIASRKLGFKPL